MKIVKYIILELLLLIVMSICGTLIIKLFDFMLKMNYENIWSIGFKVGFASWLIFSVLYGIIKLRRNRNTQ